MAGSVNQVILICLAIALHDVDGPIHCQTGEKIRLQGIGATETNGRCNPNQPCAPGDPFEQRRKMARIIGATIEREDMGRDGKPRLYGQLWFKRPVRLECNVTGTSRGRLTAWCQLPNGRDLSCEAIKYRIAARWSIYDRDRKLTGCSPHSG